MIPMSVSQSTKSRLALALTSTDAANEILGELGTGSPSSPVVPVTITATSGSLPSAGSTATVAVAGTPTVQELLQICMDLRANVVSLQAVLHAQGLTS
jgi:hypothetical protein